MRRIVPQRGPDLADRVIDAALGVDGRVRAPQGRFDLLAGDQLALSIRKEHEQFHGLAFELDTPAGTAKFVAPQI